MLTTFDNPFDPFEDFDNWFQFDIEKGYNSCGKLARFAEINESMTEKEYLMETERAIDRVINVDFLNVYKKVSKELEEITELPESYADYD